MTSIIVFKANNDRQVIIAGDTKHSFTSSTFEATKIFPLKDNKIILCGAGRDKVIESIYTKIISEEDLDNCKNKIHQLRNEGLNGIYNLYDIEDRITPSDIHATDFIIINSQDLNGKKIKADNSLPLGNLAGIGSGTEYLGQIQEDLEELYPKEFNEENKEEFFRAILNSFCTLGRNDPNTGHPAIFRLEVVLNYFNFFIL
jgi:ATP-dependent protease HslVU (ClpYQ) peptidase subunit